MIIMHLNIKKISKEFQINIGFKKVVIYLPKQLKIDSNLFVNLSDETDISYILEKQAIYLFNQGDKKQSALFTIASLWQGNNNYNFINEIEDCYPGITNKILKMNNKTEFEESFQILQSKNILQ